MYQNMQYYVLANGRNMRDLYLQCACNKKRDKTAEI